MSEVNLTKSYLSKALKELMCVKDFQKISVTDICEKCGMNRKSFYYHFKDKYDLMNWIFYTDFITMVRTKELHDGWDLLEAVMELFYEDKEFYRSALMTEGQNSFSEYFHESMLPIMSFMYDQEESTDTIIHICADACLSAAAQWLNHGCKLSPKDFIAQIQKLITKVAKSID